MDQNGPRRKMDLRDHGGVRIRWSGMIENRAVRQFLPGNKTGLCCRAVLFHAAIAGKIRLKMKLFQSPGMSSCWQSKQ